LVSEAKTNIINTPAPGLRRGLMDVQPKTQKERTDRMTNPLRLAADHYRKALEEIQLITRRATQGHGDKCGCASCIVEAKASRALIPLAWETIE